jgi:SAM-dependent methyltransferase
MNLLKEINLYLNTFGLNSKKFLLSVKGIPAFLKNHSRFKALLKVNNSEFSISKIYPCLDDRFQSAGDISLHYFFQDLFVAQRIYLNNPQKHVDIGSRLDGFVSHVASFREIEVLDIRKIDYVISNVKFVQADITSEDFINHNYCDSVSCLHVIEHLGLGRYGDNLDVNGHLKGLDNIYKLLKAGGKFYFSTPIGRQRIEYNAHRVFSLRYLLKLFEGKYRIDIFSFIDDNNLLQENVQLNNDVINSNCGCSFGCGIFEMTKL